MFGQARTRDDNLGKESRGQVLVQPIRCRSGGGGGIAFSQVRSTCVCEDAAPVPPPTYRTHAPLPRLGRLSLKKHCAHPLGSLQVLLVTLQRREESPPFWQIPNTGRGAVGDTGLGTQTPTAGSNLQPQSVLDPSQGLFRICSLSFLAGWLHAPFSPTLLWCLLLVVRHLVGMSRRRRTTLGRECHFSLRFVV